MNHEFIGFSILKETFTLKTNKRYLVKLKRYFYKKQENMFEKPS